MSPQLEVFVVSGPKVNGTYIRPTEVAEYLL